MLLFASLLNFANGKRWELWEFPETKMNQSIISMVFNVNFVYFSLLLCKSNFEKASFALVIDCTLVNSLIVQVEVEWLDFYWHSMWK